MRWQNKEIRIEKQGTLHLRFDRPHEKNNIAQAAIGYCPLHLLLMTRLVRPGDPQYPPLWPHTRPGLDQHRKTFDRINPAEEESCPGATANCSLRFGAVASRTLLRQIDSIRNNRHRNLKPQALQ